MIKINKNIINRDVSRYNADLKEFIKKFFELEAVKRYLQAKDFDQLYSEWIRFNMYMKKSYRRRCLTQILLLADINFIDHLTYLCADIFDVPGLFAIDISNTIEHADSNLLDGIDLHTVNYAGNISEWEEKFPNVYIPEDVTIVCNDGQLENADEGE